MRARSVEQVIAPKDDHEHGVAYGATGRVLVQKGHLWLVWRGGSTCWHGMTGNQYHPASLDVQDMTPKGRGIGRSLHEGGRLSAKLIRRLAAHIDAHLGDGVAALIDVNRTIVIEEKTDVP